ncbi:MAG: DUF1929 domain-containing protein [Solirubrobacterales bacterium]|nr:DUF1929 domain-containing protein [Solirubrobacterales bacterium]
MTAQRQRTRVRRTQAFVGLLVLVALVVVNGPPLVGFGKHEYHQWQITRLSYKEKYGYWANLPIPSGKRVNAIHSILLNTGKVLIMAGSGNDVGNFAAGKFESVVYNPANNTFKKIKTPSDLFCSGHVILPDGKVLIAGGTTRYEVLANQIRYAAGVMTIVNRSTTNSLRLAEGTTFRATSGQLYWATAAVDVPPARAGTVLRGARRIAVTNPSYTPLWVKAEKTGNAPIVNQAQNFAIPSLSGAQSAGLQASSFSITRNQQNFWGSRKSYIFNPETETYQKVSDLNIARWYPTLVGLADGKVLAVSGLDGFGNIIPGQSEIFDPKTNRWTMKRNLTKSFPTYPALFLMPNGDLFFTGASAGYGPDTQAWRTPGIWNPFTNRFQPVGKGMRAPNELETAGSLLLPPAQDQRYAVIGGGGVGQSPLSTGRIDVVDLRQRNPVWKPEGSLPVGTRYPELVITPNDGLVISGGSKGYRGLHGSDLLECHLFEPSTGKLSTLASPLVGRDYHSEALLLPDGRILTMGGNPLFGNKQDTKPEVFRQKMTIFYPPYLFHGKRPQLTGGPTQLGRGQTGVFTTPDPDAIVKARLIHPSAVTHVTDVQQRSIALTIHRNAGSVSLTVPEGAGLVPSGWYMVFVDNRIGVPSVARWVHVG